MTTDPKDCLGCRLISGFGLIGISAYVYYQARYRKNWESYAMKMVSLGTCVVGGARLLNLSFLKSTKHDQKWDKK